MSVLDWWITKYPKFWVVYLSWAITSITGGFFHAYMERS